MKSSISSQVEQNIFVDINIPDVHTINAYVQPVQCIGVMVQEAESHIVNADNTHYITASLCDTIIELN